MSSGVRVDSRQFKSCFWLRAGVESVHLKSASSDFSTLDRVIDNHPVFGFTDASYFKGEYVKPKDRHVTFLSQSSPYHSAAKKIEQKIDSNDRLRQLISALTNGWNGYNSAVEMGGAGLCCSHNDHTDTVKLKLMFNQEAVSNFRAFMAHMMPYIYPLGLYDSYLQREPYVNLAMLRDTDADKRDVFAKKISQSFSSRQLRTHPIKVKSLILGQGFYNASSRKKASRDIAKISSRGVVKMLFQGNPFDVQANNTLVNQSCRFVAR